MDDHLLFAEAIRLTLTNVGMSVVGVVTNGGDALDSARDQRPDIILVDIGLPDQDGITLGKTFLEELPGTKVVALTALEDARSVREALRAGFHGYVTKRTEVDQLKRALESVLDGQAVFPHRLGEGSVRANGSGTDPELLANQLTTREVEVLGLLVEGASGREIADRLSVSPNTVRTHVHGILSKLQVHSRLEAAAFAVRHDLVNMRA